MDTETAKTLARIETLLENNTKDISEIKVCMKEQPTMEAFNNLNERVTKIEANLSKITWTVILAVAGGLLTLVIG